MIYEATKLCGGKHGCGRELPVSEFYCTKKGPYSYCRACAVAAAERWADENPKRRLASHLVASAKNGRDAGGTDIDIDWVIERLERGVCEKSGLPFVYGQPYHPATPSIDRIDPTQPGHMKDNCRVILWCLNAFKGSASEKLFNEYLEKVSAAIIDR